MTNKVAKALSWIAFWLLIGFALLCWVNYVHADPLTAKQMDRLMDDLRWQESKYGKDPRDGDDGDSIGEFQIGAAYVVDANEWGLTSYTHE